MPVARSEILHRAFRVLHRPFRRVVVVALMSVLIIPAGELSAFAGSKGKKHYEQGQKLEAAGKFEEAAEKYLLALTEADRPEYKIGYRRAALQASLMLMRRGRELMERGEYEDAYTAFRRAYQFDQTNELAKDLAKRALEIVRKGEGAASLPEGAPFGSGEVPDVQSGRGQPPEKETTPPREPPNEVKQDIIFHDQLKAVITQLARQLGLNVAFDQSVQDKKIDVELRNVTKAQALDVILASNMLFFQPMTENTIIVAPDQTPNRSRLQQMSIQTFYLKNLDKEQMQQLQATLPMMLGGPQRVQIAFNPDMRAVIVRTAPENLKLVREIIESIDKQRPEVMIDVSIYEVARNDLTEIGNQLLYEGFFGQGSQQGPIVPSTLNILGVTAGQIITEQRLALAIPTSIIRMLQSRGKSNLVDSIQVHALDGQAVQANIGRSIPIQTAAFPSSYVNITPTQPGQQGQTQGTWGNIFGGGWGYPQIEYRDVGLNIKITPTVYNDQDVKLEMEVETSGFVEGPTSLTPIITRRSLKSVATVKTGQAAMMAGVAQKRESVSRSSLPIIGFLPIIGRFFSIPNQSADTTDILITVTPHVLRATGIEEKDRLARLAGTQLGGITGSIETYLQEMESRKRATAIEVARGESRGVEAAQPKRQPGKPGEQEVEKPAVGEQDVQVVTPPTSGTVGGRSVSESEPINVSFQMSTATPRAVEWVQVAVFLNGNYEIREGIVTVGYDARFLRFLKVADGGLLSSPEAPARVEGQADGSGKIVITARASGAGQAHSARGRLAVILFEVLGPGISQVEVDASATSFVTADGRVVPCKSIPLTVAAR